MLDVRACIMDGIEGLGRCLKVRLKGISGARSMCCLYRHGRLEARVEVGAVTLSQFSCCFYGKTRTSGRQPPSTASSSLSTRERSTGAVFLKSIRNILSLIR